MKNTYQNDYFTKQAREKNLRARSYFKLQEIDKKYNFIRSNSTIMDLGAAPGSWSQYCLHQTKNKVKILAIDLQEIQPLKNLLFKKMDIFDLNQKVIEDFFLQQDSKSHLKYDLKSHLKSHPENQSQFYFSTILSDLAPKTTGNKFSDSIASYQLVEQVLKISEQWLCADGWLIAKFFEGEDKEKLYQICKNKFSFFKVFVPKSTRANSREVFLVMHKKNL